MPIALRFGNDCFVGVTETAAYLCKSRITVIVIAAAQIRRDA